MAAGKLNNDIQVGEPMNGPDDSPVRSLCQEFGYPEPFRVLVEQVLGTIQDHLGSNLCSVLLLGSAPRGELSYLAEEDTFDCFSDLDLWVVTHKWPTDETIRDLRAALRSLEEGVARNPFFSIDATVNSRRTFALKARLERRLLNVDAVHTGRTLLGENLLPLYRDASHHELDLGTVNELLIVRPWKQLLQLPSGILSGKPSPYEVVVGRYAAARNLLEIPTILLANKNVYRPTYTARVECFTSASGPGGPPSKELRSALHASLDIKQQVHSELPFDQLYAAFIRGYLDAALRLADTEPLSDEDLLENLLVLQQQAATIRFRARPFSEIKRWKNLAKFALHRGLRGLQVVLSEVRPNLLVLVIAMHVALYDHLRGRYRQEVAEVIRAESKRLGLGPHVLRPEAFTAEWRALRSVLIRFFVAYRYGQTNAEQYIEAADWPLSQPPGGKA